MENTQIGDLYELGDHRLICGDARNRDIVQKVSADFKPILMLTDPPYGINYDCKKHDDLASLRGHKKTKNTGHVLNDHKADWASVYRLFYGDVSYVWCAQLKASEVEKSLKDCGYQIITYIVWVKQNFVLSRGDYHWQHEMCLYAVKKGRKHNWQGCRKQSSVWKINVQQGWNREKDLDMKTTHPTQKPLECMIRPIQNNTAIGDYVYDPFLGSGTTLIACEKTQRNCIGIELSPDFCDIIVRRYVNYVANQGGIAKIRKNGIEINDENFKHIHIENEFEDHLQLKFNY